jgi:spermidine/putrescine transport system permease protein
VSEGRRAKWWVPWALLAPGFIWLLLFFALPLVQLLLDSLDNSRRTRRLGGGGLKNYTQVFDQYQEVILRTFAYAAIATVICILIGYPLAYFIAMRGGRFKYALLAAVVLPFFTTYLIRTIAWRVIVDKDAPLVGLLRTVNLLGDDGELLATPTAVVFALVYNFLPFMVLPIYVSLEKIDRRLLEAGRDLYASAGRTFRKVTLPLSLPGVFAGSLLTFIPASGDFINADLLGSDRTRMIGNIIERNFLQEQFRPGISALSFVLMALILIAVIVYARLLGTEDLV